LNTALSVSNDSESHLEHSGHKTVPNIIRDVRTYAFSQTVLLLFQVQTMGSFALNHYSTCLLFICILTLAHLMSQQILHLSVSMMNCSNHSC